MKASGIVNKWVFGVLAGIVVFLPIVAEADTIHLRDGQVIRDAQNLREFEAVFMYDSGGRSVTLSKNRVQKVEDERGKVIYELRVMTMREMDPLRSPGLFEFSVNNQLVGSGGWVKEGTFRLRSGRLPDGVFREYYPSGRIKREFTVSGGNLNGVCREYYASGIIERESNLVNGLENGVSRNFFQDGTVKGESTFKNGIKEGITKLYFQSGALRSEMQFVNGVPEGMQRVFYESGKIETEVVFVNGVRHGPIVQYYEVGSVRMTGTFENGKLEGEVVIFYESGRVKTKQFFRAGRVIER